MTPGKGHSPNLARTLEGGRESLDVADGPPVVNTRWGAPRRAEECRRTGTRPRRPLSRFPLSNAGASVWLFDPERVHNKVSVLSALAANAKLAVTAKRACIRARDGAFPARSNTDSRHPDNPCSQGRAGLHYTALTGNITLMRRGAAGAAAGGMAAAEVSEIQNVGDPYAFFSSVD